MKKRSGLQIAGGILEIIAGALWLLNALWIEQLLEIFGAKFGAYQYLILYGVPAGQIISGIGSCAVKQRKGQVTNGIANILLIVGEFYFGLYQVFGLLHVVLTFLASLLYFFSAATQAKTEK